MRTILLNRSKFDFTRITAVRRFKDVVIAAINGRPTYNFRAYHAALAYELFSADTDYDWTLAAQLAVTMSREYMLRQQNEIDLGGFPSIKVDSYLYVGTAIQNLAVTIDWCGHLLSEEEIAGWKIFMRQTCWNLQNPSKSNWGGVPDVWDDGIPDKYNGWSQNDPLNNYYYSHATALTYENLVSGGDRSYVYSRLELLRNKWRTWATGSPEGTGYGLAVSSLFQIIDTWAESTGEQFPEIEETANEFIEFWIHCSLPDPVTGKFVEIVPFMDHSRESRHRIYDGDRSLILNARALSKSTKHRNLGTWWLNNIAHTKMAAGNYCNIDMLDHGKTEQVPDSTFYHATSSGHALWRTDWTKNATVISYSCGPNNQAHDHDDQGAFQVYFRDWQTVTLNAFSNTGILASPEYHSTLCFYGSDGKSIKHSNAGICPMRVLSPTEIEMDITPAYSAASGITHERYCTHGADGIIISDIFTKGSAQEAVFQVPTPHKPVITGNVAKAGNMEVRVLLPATAVLSFVDLKETTASSSTKISAYRIEVRGLVDHALVQVYIDTAALPVEPGDTTPVPDPVDPVPPPEPPPIPPEDPVLTTVPKIDAPYVLTAKPGTAKPGQSWHWQGDALWTPVELLQISDIVAICTNCIDGKTCVGRSEDGTTTSGVRKWEAVSMLTEQSRIMVSMLPPKSVESKDGGNDVRFIPYTPVIEAPPVEGPTVEELLVRISTLEDKAAALSDQVAALTEENVELRPTIDTLTAANKVLSGKLGSIREKLAELNAAAE